MTAASRRPDAASAFAATAVLPAGTAFAAGSSLRNLEHCASACGWLITSRTSASVVPDGASSTWSTFSRSERAMWKRWRCMRS